MPGERRFELLELLLRPNDLKHKVNEEQFGTPTEEESLLYYDLDQQRFFETHRPEPSAEIEAAVEEPPVPTPQVETETFPAPLDQKKVTPNFFIDLIPPNFVPRPQPLPDKGVLDNENP